MDIGAPVINREILKSESNKIRQAKLNRINITLTKKKEINESYKAMCELISDDALLVGFCRCVHWEFGELTTEEAIYALRQEILVLLTDKVFGNRSVEIIFRVLLSEINRCSQETDASLRSVDKTDLQKLLDLTDAEIQERIDPKFIRLIGIELEEIKDRIKNVELVQENHEAALKNLKPRILESTDLSLVPYLINVDNVFGWQNEIKEVFDLIADKKFISIHNFGGVGKTTFAKKFLAQYRDHYNNVIWLNVENSVSESIVLNTPLQKNLHINLSKETTVIEQFNMILNELDKTGENNLIILDIQKNHDQKFSEINRILSLRNWKKIVLTRSNLKNLNPYLLPNLNYESAYNLFKLHCSKEFDETLFREFLEFIEYNTLTIELVSKTIENSYDLTLEFIYDALKTQNLNSNLLKIDIDLNDEENRVVAIFDFILQSFSIENLENKEKYFLQYLALLPPSDIVIEDLILICGREFYDGNKLSYLNSINALEKKGLLQYENNKKSIRIHKILQETILYRLRNENSVYNGGQWAS
ncbi:NB-ARC domain-containing protein [Sphingobacterium siyangense]|uniref:NB-ARC domain-containing protein n=1 Tax=Sphingobacterium siyangense TaxID=459529 RepID=UPI003DA4875F